MPHCVEGEEVILSDTVVLTQELEAGFEDAGFGVLEWHAYAEHGAAVVVVKIDPFGDFTSGNAEQDGAAAVAAGCAIGLERERSFLGVGCLDKDKFEFQDLVEDAHALPHADDGFHVEVGGKEDYDAVGRDFREFH